MRNKLKYLALSALIVAGSCTKSEVVEQEPGKGNEIQAPISLIATGNTATKAMLDATTFGTDGNRIKIYDYYTATADATNGEFYIDAYAGPDVETGSSQHVAGTSWPFCDADNNLLRYNWTAGGVHKFYGWLAKDANFTTQLTAEAFFGNGFSFNTTTQTLTIPSKAMTPTTAQFDFMYSNISVRDLNTTPDYSMVGMEFSHLFTAFSIGAINTTDAQVEITEFAIENFESTTSATINFSGNTPVVNYGAFSTNSNPYIKTTTPITLAGNGGRVGDIFTQSAQEVYTLVWPLESTQLHSTSELTEDATTGAIVYPDDYKMVIKYTQDGTQYTKRINFPDVAWEAGKKYHFDIVIADKMVQLICTVNPWNYISQDIDFANETVSIKEGKTLTWDKEKSTIDETNKIVYIKNGQAAVGTFHLDTPQGGSWMATLTGDIDAFQLSPTNGTIDENPSTISVFPLINNPDRDYSVTIRFVVRRADGRNIAADEAIQPVKYTITLQNAN